jgi:hypothetical protein
MWTEEVTHTPMEDTRQMTHDSNTYECPGCGLRGPTHKVFGTMICEYASERSPLMDADTHQPITWEQVDDRHAAEEIDNAERRGFLGVPATTEFFARKGFNINNKEQDT